MKNKLLLILLIITLLLCNFNIVAKINTNSINTTDSIIKNINLSIENGQYDKAILFLKQIISNEKILNSNYLMNIDYSLIFLSQKITANKNVRLFANKIKPFVSKLEKIKGLEIKEKAFNDFCIGIIYLQTEDYNKSLNYFKKSFIEYNKLKNEEYLTYVCNGLSFIYSKINDFSKAELYFQQTITHMSYSKTFPNLNKYNVWQSSSLNAYKSKNYSLAIERLDSAYYYIDNIPNDNKADLFDCYGLTYTKLGKYLKAEENFIKAINYRKADKSVNIINLSKDYENYAELLSKIGKSKEAIEMGKKSCNLVLQALGSKSSSTSLAYSSLGSTLMENKQYTEAIEIYNKALLSSSSDTVLKPNELFPDSASVIYLPDYIRALKGKAIVLYRIAKESNCNIEGTLKQSLACNLKAIYHLEKLRSGYQFDEGKLMLSENEREVYNQAIKTSFDLYNNTHNNDYINVAFDISERSKAAVLLEKISIQSNTQGNGDYNMLFTFDQKLRKEISFLEKNISENQFSENNIKDKLKTHLFKLIDIQENFFSLLKNKYPEYYNTWLFPQLATISQIQNKLSSDESFVEYYLSDSAIYSIVISNDNKYFNKQLCCDYVLTNYINNYRNEISTFDLESSTSKGLNSFTTQSYNLYLSLIKPIKNQLNKKSLIISADGILNYLPFETLIQNNYLLLNVDYRKMNYLILNYQINYAYSATLYNSKFNTDNLPQKNILAIAPDYSTSNSQIAELITRSGNIALKGAKNEAININSIIKGDVLYNKQASESMFKQSAPEYSILHLAMHGETDNADPLNSELVFENGGAGEDGLLHAWEIYNMHLKSSLIVLSACNTGTGKVRNGEGVMSLARAFTYAGCPSVVMTLWSVSDLSSTNLMESFYAFLSKGDNKSEALQKAKINYILNSSPANSHPYYWSGYVMIGDKSPIKLESGNKTLYTATASFGVLSLLFFIILKKRKGRNI